MHKYKITGTVRAITLDPNKTYAIFNSGTDSSGSTSTGVIFISSVNTVQTVNYAEQPDAIFLKPNVGTEIQGYPVIHCIGSNSDTMLLVTTKRSQ